MALKKNAVQKGVHEDEKPWTPPVRKQAKCQAATNRQNRRPWILERKTRFELATFCLLSEPAMEKANAYQRGQHNSLTRGGDTAWIKQESPLGHPGALSQLEGEVQSD
jgi:hypothetical protein